MSKYSASFKERVVAFYGGGERSYADVGLQFGIDHSTVRKWVGLHAAHGSAGLAKKRSCYDATFKMSVLQRMWTEGLSYRHAAAIFNIRNASCLPAWQRCYERGGIEGLAPRRTGRPPGMKKPQPSSETPDPSTDSTKSREELLAELAYLRMENAYLKKLEALTQARQTPTGRKPSRR